MVQLGQFSSANLNLLGIRDLRRLAFSIGVYGYTKYSKSELIDHILAVVYGKEPPKTSTGRGRPTIINKTPKEVFADILSKLENTQTVELADSMPLVASSGDEYDTEQKPEITLSGFALSTPEGHLLLSCKSGKWEVIAHISEQIAALSNPISGRQISGSATYEYPTGYVLKELHSCVPAVSGNFDAEGLDLLGKPISFAGTPLAPADVFAPLAQGRRLLITGSARTLDITSASIIETLKTRQDTILLLPCMLPEELESVKHSPLLFATALDEPDQTVRRITQLAFDHAARLAEQGKHPLVVIGSITRLAKAFGAGAVEAIAMGQTLDSQALSALKGLCIRAHHTKQNHSITLVAFGEQTSAIDAALLAQLSDTFGTHWVLDETLLATSPHFPLDVLLSFSKKGNYINPKLEEQASVLRNQVLSGEQSKADALKRINL